MAFEPNKVNTRTVIKRKISTLERSIMFLIIISNITPPKPISIDEVEPLMAERENEADIEKIPPREE